MAKSRGLFVCQECGAQQIRWTGRCPECSAWNSFSAAKTDLAGGARERVRPISGVPIHETQRFATNLGEFDRVLGGGVVPGSLVLLGGEPGAGKSTLTTQVCHRLAQAGRKVLYVSGEESEAQVSLRARRLACERADLYLLADTDVSSVIETIIEMSPDWVVIDSIQALYDAQLGSVAGSVTQVREIASRMMRLAKGQGTAICLVGHVTKEGTLAGPRVLEHLVDTVLYFEGDRFRSYRILRAVKNRFGSTSEIGVFEMTQGGLVEVPEPSALFLAERAPGATGSAIAVPLEGTRPLLVEIQALVAPSALAAPRRAATGIDPARLVQILAVLERRIGLAVSRMDVYVNVVGGVEVAEPSGDLAIALAIGSSMHDRALPSDLVVIGELGLGGEIRSATQVEQRLREAAKLGFGKALLPQGNFGRLPEIVGMETMPISNLAEAFSSVLVG